MDRTAAWPAPTAPTAPTASATPLPDGAVLHRFARGRRWYSLVLYPDIAVIVRTTPGFGGLGGLVLRAAVSGRRRRHLERLAPQGPATVVHAFGGCELIDLRTVTYVQIRSGALRQRVVVFHREGLEPVTLPYNGGAHTVSGLWQAFAPLVGSRFVVDHDVRVQG